MTQLVEFVDELPKSSTIQCDISGCSSWWRWLLPLLWALNALTRILDSFKLGDQLNVPFQDNLQNLHLNWQHLKLMMMMLTMMMIALASQPLSLPTWLSGQFAKPRHATDLSYCTTRLGNYNKHTVISESFEPKNELLDIVILRSIILPVLTREMTLPKKSQLWRYKYKV